MARKPTARVVIGLLKDLHIRTLRRESCLFYTALAIFFLLAIGMPIAVVLLVSHGVHGGITVVGIATEGGGLLAAWRILVYSRNYFKDATELDQMITKLHVLEFQFASDEPLDQRRLEEFTSAIREIVDSPLNQLDANMRRDASQQLKDPSSRVLAKRKVTQQGEG